jgi:hypothetical protein
MAASKGVLPYWLAQVKGIGQKLNPAPYFGRTKIILSSCLDTMSAAEAAGWHFKSGISALLLRIGRAMQVMAS